MAFLERLPARRIDLSMRHIKGTGTGNLRKFWPISGLAYNG